MTRFERDWDERIYPVLVEKDPFRFVIRMQVLLEDIIDQGIDTALPSGTPNELRRLRWPARLALAQALELITEEIAQGIRTFSTIRNEFAHGLQDDLTKEHAHAMAEAVEPFLGEVFDVDDFSEGDAVKIAARILWLVTQETVEFALQQREDAEARLAAYGQAHTLSWNQVAARLFPKYEEASEDPV